MAKFQAGLRGVEVDMWAYDVVRWRETVMPVRQLINSFVISDAGAEPVMSNPSIDRTSPGKPGTASHVKR